MNFARRPRLTSDELAASLERTFAPRDSTHPVWIFGYGSLIWKPELDFDRRVPARVFGYHRQLCLRSIRYRGTDDCPGIVCGLDRGGSCAGVAYRLPLAGQRAQLERLWEREMFMGSYDARWVRLRRLDENEEFVGLAFVVRRDAPNYCGRLPEHELLDVLTRACGQYGSSLDYLLRTTESLRSHGVPDPHLERLARKAGSSIAVSGSSSLDQRAKST